MPDQAQLEQLLSFVLDPAWYRARYQDVGKSGADPLRHFIDHGLAEGRDPNGWFDGGWYLRRYADAATAGAIPLLHYLTEGAAQGRDPHPRFDAAWYIHQHPEAASNPMLFHVRIGAARSWPAERSVVIGDYLPSPQPPLPDPADVSVDIIVPVWRGLDITRRCLESVLADNDRPAGDIIVIDDASPDRPVSAYLTRLAHSRRITLLRNKKNLGFIGSVNRGMMAAGDHDVVLLNSDTEVPPGWLRRLRAQAYAAPKIASVSPLSNNATICSYPAFSGGPIPPGMSLKTLDEACQTVNAGRYVTAPTTVGFCMYIRRAALAEIGLFDQETFGAGYGEENDFCMRASAAGWSHHIACDTFVFHESGASFGERTDPLVAQAFTILKQRYPDYEPLVTRHVRDDENAPYRFAITMAMFRATGKPVILSVSHGLGGGVRRNMRELAAGGNAHHLLLEPAAHGVTISVPELSGHPILTLPAERWRDAALIARSAGVTRVHIHHLMGMDLDVRALIHELAVPFDVTIHDYFTLCPQVTLQSWPANAYCGEPGPAGCDACIANRPSHGATDILSWRNSFAWVFREADRVLAPSHDTRLRLLRHGVSRNVVLAQHEATPPGPWIMRPASRTSLPIRVAILGVLANHKGAHVAASVAMAADPAEVEIHLIGETEAGFPEAARRRMRISGPYQDEDLPALLADLDPAVIWFPALWPETYSYTLSAAIASGRPIVAADIGAFPERLAGRPRTGLVTPSADPEVWLAAFSSVTRPGRKRGSLAARPEVKLIPAPAVIARREGIVDLRRPDRTAVVIIPETISGYTSPCAHIRLLRPLDHPATGRGMETTIADSATALHYQADIIVTQRHAIPSLEAAGALAAHAKRTGATLVYDLDDDLLTIPPDHPEAADLTPKAAIVERMVRLADLVRTSTAPLAAKVASLARRVLIAENLLDERIWVQRDPRPLDRFRPVRVLYMGTATHDADFEMILPALTAIHEQFGGQVRMDLIGVAARSAVPDWIERITLPIHAARSYAGFVQWITSAGPWAIGLAPLVNTPFNACKSAIKTLDYAALGLASLASDVPSYRGSVADGPGGFLVPNAADAWYAALSRLIRDETLRHGLMTAGTRWFQENGTMAARAEAWRAAWPNTKSGAAKSGAAKSGATKSGAG